MSSPQTSVGLNRSIDLLRMPDHGNVIEVESGWAFTPYGQVERRCAGSGRPLLIVPGLWGGSRLVQPAIRELAKTWRVHWFDWPGDGSSILAESRRNVFQPQKILSTVIDATGERDLTILAHSFGAWVAIKAMFGGIDLRVRHVYVTGSGSCQARRPADVFLGKLSNKDRIAATDPYLAALAKSALGADASAPGALRAVLGAFSQTSPDALAARLAWMREAICGNDHQASSLPVSVLVSDRDTIEPIQSQLRLARSIGSRIVPMPGTGYLACLTHAANVAWTIARAESEFAASSHLLKAGSE